MKLRREHFPDDVLASPELWEQWLVYRRRIERQLRNWRTRRGFCLERGCKYRRVRGGTCCRYHTSCRNRAVARHLRRKET